MKDHLANMAAIDKATDEEKARRVMALEMRLAERRALARQKVSHGYLSYPWNIIASFNGGRGCCIVQMDLPIRDANST